jgi:hypothetical protein
VVPFAPFAQKKFVRNSDPVSCEKPYSHATAPVALCSNNRISFSGNQKSICYHARAIHGGEVKFQFNDGGRKAAGYKGNTGDCVVRSVAIGTGLPYQQIYDAVNNAALSERTGKRKRGRSNARTGVYKTTIKRLMESLGWKWTPTMQIGSGCKVHLRADELPSGRLVVSVSKHITAVIDGVIHDTHDCSRRGTRCVYGYWRA